MDRAALSQIARSAPDPSGTHARANAAIDSNDTDLGLEAEAIFMQ